MAILRSFLAANYHWRLTQGGTIGLDESSDVVALCYRVPLLLAEPARIEDIVAKLAGTADHWMRRLGDALVAPVRRRRFPGAGLSRNGLAGADEHEGPGHGAFVGR